MATFLKFYPFVEDLAEKVHNLGSDALVLALCASANAPTTANRLLGDLTQIAYTNLSSRAPSSRPRPAESRPRSLRRRQRQLAPAPSSCACAPSTQAARSATSPTTRRGTWPCS